MTLPKLSKGAVVVGDSDIFNSDSEVLNTTANSLDEQNIIAMDIDNNAAFEDFNINDKPAEPYNPNPDIINVEGYQRDDGTWVRGHQRTVPDDYLSNNLNKPS